MGGHDHEGRRLEGIGATHQVEGVLHVVTARCQLHTSRPKTTDRRDPARGEALIITSLEEEIRLRQGDHADAGASESVSDPTNPVTVEGRQAHTMTRGHRVRSMCLHR